MKNKLSVNKTALAMAVAQAFAINTSSAAIITVNNSLDAGVGCTLREAITSINAGVASGGCVASGVLGTNDSIDFSVSEVIVSGSELAITENVSFNPDGSEVTIDGDGFEGVFYIENSTVSFDRVTITGGNTIGGGGGIYAYNSSVSLNNSTVSGNEADYGAGIYSNVSTIELSNSTVSGNSAEDYGGGIYAYANSTVTLSNSTVSSNLSGAYTGGIFNASGVLELSNSTVTGNSGSTTYYSYGGGIAVLFSTVTLNNNLIAGNTAFDAGELYNIGSTITSNSNLFGDSVVFFTPSTSDTLIDLNQTNLSTVLSPLADNGGPTLTHVLPPGSPAIDAGDNTVCAAAPVNNRDQRGESRLSGSACDIGAVEVQAVVTAPIGDEALFVVPLPNGNSVIFGL